ncbi:MAG: PCYCGC motif-containing (lipo)protein, partial [Candidatus Hydrothermarchaeales archaeon]
AYTIATEMPEILEKMPCYCSCVRVGHKSLKDCFLSSNGGYSQHGANCNLCIYEALDVKKWHEGGLDIKEIRSRIDEKYGGGRFAEGTDTPPV